MFRNEFPRTNVPRSTELYLARHLVGLRVACVRHFKADTAGRLAKQTSPRNSSDLFASVVVSSSSVTVHTSADRG